MALVSVGDQAVRSAWLEWDRRQRCQQGSMIVAVDLPNRPAEGRPALRERLQGDRQLGRRTLLKAVAVDNDRQAIQPELGSRHCRLPDTALLKLAITADHVRAPVRSGNLRSEGSADADAQSVAQWSRTGLHTRHLARIRMTIQPRQWLLERVQLSRRKESSSGEGHVQRARAVALAEDETVTFGRIRPLRIDVEHAEIQCREDINHREVAPCMTKPGSVDHGKIALSRLIRKRT